MLQMRARSWAIRDAAPHLLFGPTYEELVAVEEHRGPDRARDITPAAAPRTAQDRRAAMEAIDAAPVAAPAAPQAQHEHEPETGEVLENGNGKRAVMVELWLGPKAQSQADHRTAATDLAQAMKACNLEPMLNALIENNGWAADLPTSWQERLLKVADETRERIRRESGDDSWLEGGDPIDDVGIDAEAELPLDAA